MNSLSCCRFLHRGPRGPGKYRSIDARPLAATVVSTWWRASPPIPISRVIQRMSANVDDARLGRRLTWRLWLCRKLKHRCLLTLMQVRQENKCAIRKFECVVMHLWYVLIDLSKDRRSGAYCSPAKETVTSAEKASSVPGRKRSDMIQALAPKRSDQAFSVWVLPRRPR